MGGMLSPPEQVGEFVFGLHNVIVTGGNNVYIVDSWLTSYPDNGVEGLEAIIKRARVLLLKMPYKECAELLEADEKKYTKDDVKERTIDNPQYCLE